MQISLDQSYFGRGAASVQKISQRKLTKLFRRSAFKILQFCRRESKKMKKRNEYQTILFPTDYEYQHSQEVSSALVEKYRDLADYPFYLTHCQLFIDNYHLKVVRRATSIPMKFSSIGYGELREFGSWVGAADASVLVGVTTLNIVLMISLGGKHFHKYRMAGSKKGEVLPVVNVSLHRHFLFVFSPQQCHACRFPDPKSPQKGLERVVQKVMTDKSITRGVGIEREGKFYTFMLIERALVVQRLEAGLLLSKIDSKCKLLHEGALPLLHLVVHPRTNTNITHVVIAVATAEQVKLLSYNLDSETVGVLASIPNPAVIYRKGKVDAPLLQFLQRDAYLLCGIGFKNRLYFAKIEADYCEISRRVKFEDPIEYLGELGSSYGIAVITNLLKEGRYHRKIYVTHEEKLVSFSDFLYTELIDKYQAPFESDSLPYVSPFSPNKAVHIHSRREVLLIGGGELQRVVLSRWQEIYREMRVTENIKLLKFLLLLNHVPSPFLIRPNSFDGLQAFFPLTSPLSQQILLQYYFHMDMEPALVDISKNYELMVPFVLGHQVGNLGDATMEGLKEWCVKFDERLVEEMIIGGADCGWEIAVSRGWVRAFKVMVERGMDLEVPLIKLCHLAFKELRTENKLQQGVNYLNQMIEYMLFLLGNFFQDLQGNGSSQDFSHILSILLKEELWSLIMQFSRMRGIGIISALFCTEIRIREINRCSPMIFIRCHQRFPDLIINSTATNAQTILAHLSATYQQEVQKEKEGQTKEAQAQQMQELHMEHAKLLVLQYQEYLRGAGSGGVFKECLRTYEIFLTQPYYEDNYQEELVRVGDRLSSKAYFRFRRDYLVSILKTMMKDQGKNLELVYFAARSSSSSRTYEELECEMADFLVFMWLLILVDLTHSTMAEHSCDLEKYGLAECERRLKADIRAGVRQVLGEVEEGHQQYLCIHLLLASNADGENSSKIFAKFLACRNTLLRQRMFVWLRGAVRESTALQEEVIVRLKEVIAVSLEESRELLEDCYEGRQRQIIEKIDHDPHLQLEYLQLIIRNTGEQLEPYYTNLHLSLIIRLTPQQLVPVLSTHNELVEYDVAEALRLTLAAGDFQGKYDTLIYLYQREGQLTQCIATYLTTFEMLVFNYISITERQEDEVPGLSLSFAHLATTASEQEEQRAKLLGEINRRFQESVRLLFRIPQRSYQQLALYLRRLNSLRQAVGAREYRFKEHYVQFVSGYLGAFLVKLFQRNCLVQVAEWLEEVRGELLEFVLQMQSFLVQGYDQMHLQLVILKSMAQMEKQMLLREIAQTLSTLNFCISSPAHCPVCDRPFHDAAAGLLFNCGHIYHRGCIDQVDDQDFCYYCVSKNQYRAMIDNVSLFLVELLQKFRKKREARRAEQEIYVEGRKKDMLITQAKKRANRLALYDKKATAIENQAEIIDIRLLIEDYYSNQAKH